VAIVTDANLFVVRQGVTHKKIFASVIRDMEMRDIPHLAILMNDLKLDEGSYGYGHGYGYGYGYGYYSDDEETMRRKSWRERVFGKKKRRRDTGRGTRD
jgi:hypothetical protein